MDCKIFYITLPTGMTISNIWKWPRRTRCAERRKCMAIVVRGRVTDTDVTKTVRYRECSWHPQRESWRTARIRWHLSRLWWSAPSVNFPDVGLFGCSWTPWWSGIAPQQSHRPINLRTLILWLSFLGWAMVRLQRRFEEG